MAGIAAKAVGSNISTIMLHRGQTEVHNSNARFKVVVAGRRWGKSMLALISLIKWAQIPGSRVWYVAPSYRLAKQIIWDELKAAVPRNWVKKIHETELSIRLVNGSIIECKGADDPNGLLGVGLNYVILDEFQDMKENVWKRSLRPTLARDRGHAMFIGTPRGYNLLYDVHMLGQDPDNKMWDSWVFPTVTSPFIPSEEIEQARSDMDIKTFRQEFEASFENMSGRVYYQFDRNIHTGKFPFNPDLPIWVGQDFNIDPMATAIMQPQRDGSIHVVDEIYKHGSNTLEICDILEQRYYKYMGKNNGQVCIYPDPAGTARQHARGESDLDIFRERGFNYIKFRRKHPRISDRVNAVNRMLMDANGQVRMHVDSKCKNVIKSFEQVLYKEGTPDIDKRPSVEHITDALGYPIELEYPTRKIVIAGRSL